MAFISIITNDNGEYVGVDLSSGFTERNKFQCFYNSGNVVRDFVNAIKATYEEDVEMLLYSSSVDQFVTDNSDKYHFIESKKLGDMNVVAPLEVTNDEELIAYLKELKKKCN